MSFLYILGSQIGIHIIIEQYYKCGNKFIIFLLLNVTTLKTKPKFFIAKVQILCCISNNFLSN